MNLELSEEQMNGIVDIIDGTISTLLDDEPFDHPDVKFWFGILRKCGDRGNKIIEAYTATNVPAWQRSKT